MTTTPYCVVNGVFVIDAILPANILHEEPTKNGKYSLAHKDVKERGLPVETGRRLQINRHVYNVVCQAVDRLAWILLRIEE